MGMPSKLKNLNIYNDNRSLQGVATSFTPPKLGRKLEAFRAGGMLGAVQADHGLADDALQMTWTVGGYDAQILKQLGATGVAGVQLRFASAYQRDDTEEVLAVEIVVRGRHTEIDRGTGKTGDDTEWTITTDATYYKEVVNGETIVEIDKLGMIEMIGGVDRQEAIRRAIGI